ncbi:MAG: 1-(5-phosphoribosyl)-5-[(5-phosphoribosylamino)methylideneamino]imidazole-4-carboxamide isomerase [Clostridiales bacterium]|nr:1-(5-phosphoribosyl)-5-[(5-phosphoribosylamino)methylideneamino]imidazole-4-carboxamide isomerase [Clostridiales bacterium]
MIIFPAIDIMGGKPVRLYKGNFSTAHRVADDAVETAKSFESCGAEWVHMVDLDGSLKKKPVNGDVFIKVASETSLKVEIGGGIRKISDINYYFEHGVSRVILGSAALKNPKLVEQAVKEFGASIAVGIDAENGFAAAEGWTENSGIYFTDIAKKMESIGVETIIYTDISKDGTLSGPNLKQLMQINNAVSCNIIASGGVTDINDILKLKNANLYGAICGKSIYSGSINLREAVEICKE